MNAVVILVMIVVLLGTLLYFFGVAIRSASRVHTPEDYFPHHGRLKTISVFSTLYAAEMSIATVFIAFFDLAPILKATLFLSIGTFCLGQLVLWFAIPKMKSVNPDGKTLAGVLSAHYQSQWVKIIATTVLAIGSAGLFGMEIVVGSKLVGAVTGSSSMQAITVFVVAAVVIFYTLMGGFRNVLKTDKAQASLIWVVILILAAAAYIGTKNPTVNIGEALGTVQWGLPVFGFLVNLLIINVAYPLADMAAWHRVGLAASVKDARHGFGFGIVSFFISWSVILIAAVVLTKLTGVSGAEAIVNAAFSLSGGSLITALFAGIGLGCLLSALLSTGDVFLVNAAQAIWEAQTRQPVDASQALARIRKITLFVGATSLVVIFWLSMKGANVADLVFVVYGSATALVPSVLVMLLDPASKVIPKYAPAAIVSSIVGTAAGWFYGVAAISGNKELVALINRVDFVPGTLSPFNSAATALGWSVAVYAVVAIVPFLNRKVSRTSAE